LKIASLRLHRFQELEGRLRPCFALAVRDHFEGAYTGSQYYLDGVLRQQGIEVCDPLPWLPRRSKIGDTSEAGLR
jgi:hypothetical protein